MDTARFDRLLPDALSGRNATEVAADAPAGETPSDRPVLLVNMIATADGRASVGGRTVEIGNQADYELFHALRARADAVLVGAETVRVEGYGRMIVDPEVRARRVREGMEADALAVIVTRSAHLPPDNQLLRAEGTRIVVITPSPDATLPPTAGEVTYLRGSLQDGVRALRRELGVRTVLCEGGPALLGELIHAGMVDELFLALAPLLASGDGPLTILRGEHFVPPVQMRLLSVHESGGYLFLRYAL